MRNIPIWCLGLLCLTAAGVAAQQAERKTASRQPAFTAAQAARGKQAYDANCAGCHLPGLEGSSKANVRGAPLIETRFVQDFGEQRISALFNKMKRDMPAGKPGSLTDAQYLDIAAYILQQNKFPAGADELTSDAATDIWIPGAGGAEGLADYTYVSGVGCLSQDATRSWLLVKAQGLKKDDPAAPAALPDAPGEYTFRLLGAYNYAPEPQNGRMVRVSGYLVRLGAENRVFVQQLRATGVTCDGTAIPASTMAPAMSPPVPQQPVIASPLPAQADAPTVWSGVYSEAQAYNGQRVADTLCAGCHGAGLAGGDSGPKLAGADFLGEWNGRSAGELFNYISEKMPENAPGTLKKEDVASAVAYILQVNNLPAGRQALPADSAALAAIAIRAAKP